MSDLLITPLTKPFDVTITPPGSKSLTNRALVLAALSDGVCPLSNVLFADDTLVMLECLGRLGFHLQIDHDAHAVTVYGGSGRIAAPTAELFCGNSGTTIRFLTALCALGKGSYTLDGIARMRQRPIAQLVDLLHNLGARTRYTIDQGFPPIQVLADGLAGGLLRFGAAQSSQFLSAVLMAAPYARHEVQIELDSGQTSWPYVAMTMQLMDHFGVTPELVRDPDSGEPRQIVVPRQTYRATEYAIEPDASNASYFLAAAALHEGSKLTIEHLGKSSLQGDVAFADLLHRMGAGLVFGKDFITIMGSARLAGIDVDLRDMPDMAQTLAVVALFAHGQTRLSGLHTLRNKETDRLEALSTELSRLGADVDVEADDALVIEPPDRLRVPAEIHTYDDHRMAMSFALAGTREPGITIRDLECVNKTYPQYFADLAKLGM
jgi:3-phosphoshikimate 1-carboxyvinyltransferase